MFNYLMTVSYDGKNYSGWQIQQGKDTIEGILTKEVSVIAGTETQLHASGRTDAGVSALAQPVSFNTERQLDLSSFVGRVNHFLPKEIRVLDIKQVADDFHARYSAKRKTYCYCFYLSKHNIPYYDKIASHFRDDVNIQKLYENVNMLIGTHDFTSFCAANTPVKSKVRTIQEAKLEVVGDLFKFTITGNGFLYNMVRIIVGTLIDVSCGKIQLSIAEIINKKDRTAAGHTAPSDGLVLNNVMYD